MLLAIDASTKSLGYAVFDKNELQDYGCITAYSNDLISRISKIIKELRTVLEKYNIDMIVLEEVRPENNNNNIQKTQPGNNNNVYRQSIKTHRALMWMQAAIAFLAHDINKSIKIDYIYPSEWRKRCSIHTGRGIKREVLKQKDIEFVKEKYGLDVNDDIADAIGIGYGYFHKGKKESAF